MRAGMLLWDVLGEPRVPNGRNEKIHFFIFISSCTIIHEFCVLDMSQSRTSPVAVAVCQVPLLPSKACRPGSLGAKRCNCTFSLVWLKSPLLPHLPAP